jgi:hypothetical protein
MERILREDEDKFLTALPAEPMPSPGRTGMKHERGSVAGAF